MKIYISLLLSFFVPIWFLGQTPIYLEPVKGAFIHNEWICNAFEGGLPGGEHRSPCFYDIDGDGDYDLLYGKKDGRLSYFENQGDAYEPCFVLITDSFGDIKAPQGWASPSIADINNDGLLDIFLGTGLDAGLGGYVQLYLQEDVGGQPAFVLAEDSVANVDVHDASVPFAADLDDDEDMDLVIAGGVGEVVYVRNIGDKNIAVWDTNTIRITIYGSWRKSPIVADIDCDGQVELIVSEAYGHLYLYENISSQPDTMIWALQTENFAGIDACQSAGGCVVRPAMVDIDADGDLDLFISSNGELQFYRNVQIIGNCPVTFNLESVDYPGISGGYYPVVKDINNDNLPDLFVSDGSRVVHYSMMDSLTENHWQLVSPYFLGLEGDFLYADFFDFNRDSLVDMLTIEDKKLKMFLRSGAVSDLDFHFVADPVLDAFQIQDYWATFDIVDINANGFADLILVDDDKLHWLEYVKDSVGYTWTYVGLLSVDDLPSVVRKPSFGDVDNDGDLDMIAYTGFGVKLFLNTGNAQQPHFQPTNDFLVYAFGPGNHAYPEIAELDGSCGFELLTGSGNFIRYYDYQGIEPQIIPPDNNVFCESDSTIQLQAEPYDSLHSYWTGAATESGIIDISADPGSYTAIYHYIDPFDCFERTDTFIFFVIDNPVVELCSFDTILINDPPLDLNCGIPQGGVYSGNGVQNRFFYPEIAGIGVHTIFYTFTDDNGCSNLDSTYIVVDEITRNLDQPDLFRHEIFPNPCSGSLYLSIIGTTENLTINIMDLRGRRVFQIQGLNVIENDITELRLGVIPKGVYVFEIKGSNVWELEKLVIQ